jgi:hypothetical protein
MPAFMDYTVGMKKRQKVQYTVRDVPVELDRRLRDSARVAVRLEERDRGRPLEQREQRITAGRFCRAPRKRVLHDGEARAMLEQL